VLASVTWCYYICWAIILWATIHSTTSRHKRWMHKRGTSRRSTVEFKQEKICDLVGTLLTRVDIILPSIEHFRTNTNWLRLFMNNATGTKHARKNTNHAIKCVVIIMTMTDAHNITYYIYIYIYIQRPDAHLIHWYYRHCLPGGR